MHFFSSETSGILNNIIWGVLGACHLIYLLGCIGVLAYNSLMWATDNCSSSSLRFLWKHPARYFCKIPDDVQNFSRDHICPCGKCATPYLFVGIIPPLFPSWKKGPCVPGFVRLAFIVLGFLDLNGVCARRLFSFAFQSFILSDECVKIEVRSQYIILYSMTKEKGSMGNSSDIFYPIYIVFEGIQVSYGEFILNIRRRVVQWDTSILSISNTLTDSGFLLLHVDRS